MRLPLLVKWTAAMIVVAAIPFASLAVRSTEIQRDGLVNAERQIQLAVVDHAATLVADSADSAAEATHRVGALLTEPSIRDDEARLRLAREAMARADLLALVGIYTPDGHLIDGIARTSGTTVKPSPALTAEEMDGGSASPHWNGTRYVEPVLRDGATRAIVVGILDLSALGARLEGLSKDRFESRPDGVLLLDGSARVLAPDGAGILAAGSMLAGHDLLRQATLGQAPFVHDFAFSSEFVSESGEEMSGTVRALPDRGWAIAVRRSRAAAYAQLAASRRALLESGALLAIVAIALGFVIARWTTRPVRQLTALTRAYGARRFAERSTVRTGDELEELGGAMEVMADRLSTSEAEIAHRTRVQTNLSRFLPAQVAASIAEGKSDLALGGERRRVSVVFADVVAFTSFAEQAAPEEVVDFLNELFSVLTEVVFRHGGTVDKFIGDCVMAFFGAPTSAEDHARRAMATAEDMHRFVEANAPAWKEKHGFDVRLGIGIATGEVVVGNLGSESRMEYTAIGDIVNVAARLERLARPGQTLLTAETLTEAGSAFPTRAIGEHPLRGKSLPVTIFEVA